MEIEKMRKKALYVCVIITIIWWFVLILYITLTKLDAEYTRGLMEIEGMFKQWKTKKEEVVNKVRNFNWLRFKSLGEPTIEVNKMELRTDFNRDLNIRAFMSLHRKGHLIRNWLSSDDSNEPIDTKTNVNVTHFDVAKYFLIKKMRQKIIDIYGDSFVLPVNDSSYFRVRNWKNQQSNQSEGIASINGYVPERSQVSQESNIPHFKTSYTKNRTTLKSIFQRVNNTYNILHINETSKLGDHKWIPAKKILSMPNFNSSEVTHKSSRDKYIQNQSLDIMTKTNHSINVFELSLNETKFLRQLSNERGAFIDVYESNVHKELGPINKYIDFVYDEDKKNDVEETRIKKKIPEIEVPRIQRKKFSITIRHNKNIDNVRKDPKPRIVYKETPPPGVETKLKKIKKKIKRTGKTRI